ncbi:MAG: DNA-binding protein WhiA [Floccifex porci]|uniref:Probable cell division protein WhiA n=1 Tax=Floccifex porci TaxID=2606629 RepID=A0A7X2N392_9FIRM|nr:DNA-binding protein WhiA [Floccifex porci]MCI7803173.1 DNA-binding protein WhiA [Erysipelotrichaceae bacterium]MDD7467510.1 DNA-binding protein WhiA [Floccifex porci]MDO4480142.1 DNA-binding protein WhiA [Erysipelotrichaceae bacterium]MDY4796698.1 DNA-binding protein WhiA [Floccifex porci]MSS01678.1 DNA-binding protein WhiA [Floccifex porci]
MSFTADVKFQICQEELDDSDSKVQLCALFLMKGSVHINWQGMYLSFQSENAAISKHVFKLFKSMYDVNPRLSILKKMQLKKNNIYRIQIYEKAQEILEDLQIMTDTGLHSCPPSKMIRSEKKARAFLQGCFLGSGSINDPKTTNYHLEMSTSDEHFANLIVKAMEKFYIPAKITIRKNNYVVYIKAGEKIEDFLRLCNASKALMDFVETRSLRDFYNSMSRLDNCTLANEVKTIKAGKKQLEYIEALEKNKTKVKVSEKIQRVMEIRKKYPEASLNELCDECYLEYGEVISKSGMKHRLNKIKEMAMEFMEEKE